MFRFTAPLIAASLLTAAAAAQTPAPAAPAPAAPAAAAPVGDISGTYSFDPEHSQVVFSYQHLGFSTSRGMINGVEGTVVLDKADPAKSTVEARFPLSAIRTITPALDSHLASSPDFLNGAPPDTAVTFKSTAVKVKDDDKAEVTGDLTLNGVTKPVTLNVEMVNAGIHPMTEKPAVSFDIEGSLKRSDFNLGAFAPAVSDEVKFDISVEAAKG